MDGWCLMVYIVTAAVRVFHSRKTLPCQEELEPVGGVYGLVVAVLAMGLLVGGLLPASTLHLFEGDYLLNYT